MLFAFWMLFSSYFSSVINKNKWVHETIVSISWSNKNEEKTPREKERQHHLNWNEWMQTREYCILCVRKNEYNMKGRRDNVTHFETVVHTTTKMRFNGMWYDECGLWSAPKHCSAGNYYLLCSLIFRSVCFCSIASVACTSVPWVNECIWWLNRVKRELIGKEAETAKQNQTEREPKAATLYKTREKNQTIRQWIIIKWAQWKERREKLRIDNSETIKIKGVLCQAAIGDAV